MSGSRIAEMVLNLEDQVRIYRQLLDLSQAQLVALRAQDVHAVHAVLQEIEVTMLERSKVEQRRSALLEAIARELGVPVAEVTASLLSQVADESVGAAIADASRRLGELVAELARVVERNRVILEQELAIIDHMVKGMTAVPAAPTYGQTGAQTEVSRLKILDAKV